MAWSWEFNRCKAISNNTNRVVVTQTSSKKGNDTRSRSRDVTCQLQHLHRTERSMFHTDSSTKSGKWR